jgi:hypothetical protein
MPTTEQNRTDLSRLEPYAQVGILFPYIRRRREGGHSYGPNVLVGAAIMLTAPVAYGANRATTQVDLNTAVAT